MAEAEFHRLFRHHWEAGTGGRTRFRERWWGAQLPDGRDRWTPETFADALVHHGASVSPGLIARWVGGAGPLPDSAALLAILATFFPAPSDGSWPHPDRQRMLDAWTAALRAAGRAPPDAAAMQRLGAELLAAPREPDAIGFVVAGKRLAIAPPAQSDRDAAALPLVAQLLPLVVEKLRDLVDTMGARLDNQRAWRGLPAAARGLLGAVGNAAPEMLPDRIAVLYHRTLSLGSFVEQDDRLGGTPNALDEALEPDIRRALADALASLAPWLLQFPSVREADAARRDFLKRPELFEAVRPQVADAKRVFAEAAATGALSEEDAAEVTAIAEVAERQGLQAEKAGYRAIGTARHLVGSALGWNLCESSALFGGGGTDEAIRLALAHVLGAFLLRAEMPALRLMEGADHALASSVRRGLAMVRAEAVAASADARDEPVAPPRRQDDAATGPPPDFDTDRVRETILAGRAPPAAWVPWITELDLRKTALADLAPLAGLANLQTLLLNGTRVADLAPMAGLANLQTLQLSGTQVADLAPLAGLAKLHTLWLGGTQVADLASLAGLANLQLLLLDGTQVADLAPLAGLANLQILWLNGTQVADVTPLAGLANLQQLNLTGTQVADLAPLAGLANLQTLDLNRTRVTDLAPLAGLDKLVVAISGGEVRPAELARQGRSLRVVDIAVRRTSSRDPRFPLP